MKRTLPIEGIVDTSFLEEAAKARAVNRHGPVAESARRVDLVQPAVRRRASSAGHRHSASRPPSTSRASPRARWQSLRAVDDEAARARGQLAGLVHLVLHLDAEREATRSTSVSVTVIVTVMPHGRRGQVRDIDPRPDRALARPEVWRHRVDGRLLDEPDHVGRRQHPDRVLTEMRRRQIVGDRDRSRVRQAAASPPVALSLMAMDYGRLRARYLDRARRAGGTGARAARASPRASQARRVATSGALLYHAGAVSPPFAKVLIANRGEIAVRVIRACRELGIATVAVYSEADRDALHVLLADEAVLHRPAPRRARATSTIDKLIAARARDGRRGDPSRLRLPRRERRASPRRAPRPGSSSSARRRRRSTRWATRSAARRVAAGRACRSCRAPSSRWPTTPRPRAPPREIGFPVMIKAAAGGGGKGMRLVRERRRAAPARCARRAREAGAAFGDAAVYLERYVDAPRHIEVQVLADAHGNVVHLGERECSIQRRHQKLIEETPVAGRRRRDARRGMGEAACRLARGRRLRQRRHGRVPRRRATRQLLLPRDEHAAAGRASR